MYIHLKLDMKPIMYTYVQICIYIYVYMYMYINLRIHMQSTARERDEERSHFLLIPCIDVPFCNRFKTNSVWHYDSWDADCFAPVPSGLYTPPTNQGYKSYIVILKQEYIIYSHIKATLDP